MAWFSEDEPFASSAGGCPRRASCAILPATAFVWLVPLTWRHSVQGGWVAECRAAGMPCR